MQEGENWQHKQNERNCSGSFIISIQEHRILRESVCQVKCSEREIDKC